MTKAVVTPLGLVAWKAPLRQLAGESGSELIEIAVVMPIFLLMFFGFINFTLVIFGACNMTYAARAATRYICLHGPSSYGYTNNTAVNTAATNIINAFIFQYPSNTSSTAFSYSTSVNSSGYTATTIVTTITVTYNIVLPGYTYNGLKLSTLAAGVIPQ